MRAGPDGRRGGGEVQRRTYEGHPKICMNTGFYHYRLSVILCYSYNDS